MPAHDTTGRSARTIVRATLVLLLSLGVGGCARTLPVSTDDAAITARVRTVLLNDPEVGANQINIATTSGVVIMTGRVDSPADAERAAQLARAVEGVRDVQVQLEVGAPRP